MLISDNSRVRKIISILTLYRMRVQGYCDVCRWTISKRTSTEVKCLHLTSSRREKCTLSVSNVIYHKFSHGAAFYLLNGKNVNVMLEYGIDTRVQLSKYLLLAHNVVYFSFHGVSLVPNFEACKVCPVP